MNEPELCILAPIFNTKGHVCGI